MSYYFQRNFEVAYLKALLGAVFTKSLSCALAPKSSTQNVIITSGIRDPYKNNDHKKLISCYRLADAMVL